MKSKKLNIVNIFDVYRVAFSYIKHKIVSKLAKAMKIEPKRYEIRLDQLPPDERIRILADQLLREKEEKVLLERKLQHLEDQLNTLRQKTFAKILEELAKEEKEKGGVPVSLAELLSKARQRGLLPFAKPPVVFDLTMKKIGYLRDIIIHPNGGMAFVIEKYKGNVVTTPPFGSLWEAVFHAENLSYQLPHVIVLNLVEMEDGKMIKVPQAYINAIYQGEPVEKVIAVLKQEIDRLSSEVMSSKLAAEILSVKNSIDKIDKEVSNILATSALNLFEKTMKSVSEIIIPTSLSAIGSNTELHLEMQHQRSLAEHAKEISDLYANRLKNLEESLAPEKIIVIQNEIIERLKELSKHLSDIQLMLKEIKEDKSKSGEQAKGGEGEKS